MLHSTCRSWVAVVLASLLLAPIVGCDGDESASNQPAPQSPPARGNDGADDGASSDPSGDASAGEDVGDAAQPAPKAAAPKLDVPLPSTVDGDASKGSFVFFVAKDNPRGVAAFYQKELEAKGWKVGRNEAKQEHGLTNVVQQYGKGNDVLTVVLQEQIGSDQNLTMAQLMDVPLPPTATQIRPVAIAVTMVTPEAPDVTLAWFAKELGARGWKSLQQTTSGETRSQGHSKGGRTITVMATQNPDKKTSRVQFQHIEYAD